jgi:hypothetical protein
MNASDGPPVDIGRILSHSLDEASCAPLELPAAAFARLGLLFAGPSVSSKHAGACMPRWSALDSCSMTAVPVRFPTAHTIRLITHKLSVIDTCHVPCSWITLCPT